MSHSLICFSYLDIKPCLSRYEGKVTEHNFGSLIRMDAEEEYSESNTIFGAFREPVTGDGSVTNLPGSDAGAIFGIRGDRCVRNHPSFLNTNETTRSPVIGWD